MVSVLIFLLVSILISFLISILISFLISGLVAAPVGGILISVAGVSISSVSLTAPGIGAIVISHIGSLRMPFLLAGRGFTLFYAPLSLFRLAVIGG